MSLGMFLLLLVSASGQAVPPCGLEPADLRDERSYRDLRSGRTDGCLDWLAALAVDPGQPWDLRARALTLLEADRHRAAYVAFARDFVPAQVAADSTGAATFNLLAAWLPAREPERGLVEPLLLPGQERSGVAPILATLAGQPVHDYLRWLDGRGVVFTPDQVRALAETDDQDTRRFLCWYVGVHRLIGMERFLVHQISSSRPSTYPGQARRLFEAAFTAGLSEVIRDAAGTPPWLGDETTPKGLALASLATMMPAGRPVVDRELAASLVATALAEAGGSDRGQWRLGADLVTFLLERGEPAAPVIERTLGVLARQSLKRRGPLEPLVVVEATCRRFSVAFPELTAAERGRLWEVALTTLDAGFVGAVSRAASDREGWERLETQLLGQGEAAARGTLRVNRCFGCDLETPGDWCAAVAELGLEPAIPHVEGVLATAWVEDAVAALVRFGPVGAPALARFLVSERVRQVPLPLRVQAVRACVEGLPPAEAERLRAALQADPAMAGVVREALGGSADRPSPPRSSSSTSSRRRIPPCGRLGAAGEEMT